MSTTTAATPKPRTALPWTRGRVRWRQKCAVSKQGIYVVHTQPELVGTDKYWQAGLWRGAKALTDHMALAQGYRPLTHGCATQGEAKRICEEYEAEMLAIEGRSKARLKARHEAHLARHDY